MPLPVFDTQDAIPDAFREEYEEGDDKKWHPKAEGEIATERRKRSELLNEKKEQERLRKEAERKIADAEALAAARASGATEEQLKAIREQAEAALKPVKDELDAANAKIKKLTLTDRVQALWLKHGGMGERSEDAMDALAKRTDLGDAGGITVKNKDGSDSAESIEEFLKVTFKKEKPWLYVGTGSSGSGSSGSGGEGQDDLPARTADEQIGEKRVLVSAAL